MEKILCTFRMLSFEITNMYRERNNWFLSVKKSMPALLIDASSYLKRLWNVPSLEETELHFEIVR